MSFYASARVASSRTFFAISTCANASAGIAPKAEQAQRSFDKLPLHLYNLIGY